MKSTFIKFMEGIIESRYSNWDITRVMGKVVPTMLKMLVQKAVEETSEPFVYSKTPLAYQLIDDICSNRKLGSKAIAISAGAELTGNLILGILLQKKNTSYASMCKKLLAGIFEATHEIEKIGPEPKNLGDE